MNENKKVALIIMDGWAEGEKSGNNAIHLANTPFIDSLYSKYPHSRLTTFGEAVGLPEGQMGNSEVGHLNIGAGRVVYQELARINKSIAEGEFAGKPALLESFHHAKSNKSSLHIFGLVSNGGVHSHIEHLIEICREAERNDVAKIFVHCIMDGRDTDPMAGQKYLQKLLNTFKGSRIRIASVIGRYYAMDRDKRWERIKKAYDLMVLGSGKKSKDLEASVFESYDAGITDEFILPIVHVDDDNNAIAKISDGDAVICFNFRTDRCRQITDVLSQRDIPDQNMRKLDLHFTTMSRYDEGFKNVHVIYEKENLQKTLGEVLSAAGKKQLRIAETEKYPHVTFFFSGGREDAFPGESRIMIPSPKVATYDLQPEMSAIAVRDAVIDQINNVGPDFICLNFANPDMVAHTGVVEAAIKAVETVDQCVEKVSRAALEKGYSLIITSDHGNADFMVNADGTPNTAHTKNPVPCFLLENKSSRKINNGKLGDLAPSILKLMELPVPKEMSGQCLIH